MSGTNLKLLALLTCFLVLGPRLADPLGAQQAPKDQPAYLTGWGATKKLGRDLQQALKPAWRSEINEEPVSLETDVTPFVRPVVYPGDRPLRMIFISAGFIDLMNNVAHAKAIDKIEKGYFQKYILSLSQESGATSLQDLPNASDKRFWTEAMMNEQLSNFNQMVGMVVAIELSHHYLGNLKKYEARMTEAKGGPVPINSLLTPAEWDASVRAGAVDSLECGIGMDGVKALYEAIEKMPKRPTWTAYFLPDQINVSKLKKDLDNYEKLFFRGQLK